MICLRNVLLSPPHDVQGERVDPRGKFLLGLDQRNLFPGVQIFDHHTGEDFLSYDNTHRQTHRSMFAESEIGETKCKT